MKTLTVTLVLLLATLPVLAQDPLRPAPTDPQEIALAEAMADLAAAQATVTYLLAERELTAQQKRLEGEYPSLLELGVTLEQAPDPLYTVLVVPYAKARAADQMLWREARLRTLEQVGVSALIDTDTPWAWQIHRADLGKVCGALASVVAPEKPIEP